MKQTEAIEILELLMEGIHPVTGEILSDDDVLSEPDVILAMRAAVRALHFSVVEGKGGIQEKNDSDQYLTKRNRLNAGRPWTPEDDRKLNELYRDNTSLEEICSILQRRIRGVNNRLAFLGLIQTERDPYRTPGMERAGMSWTPEEDQKLLDLFNQQQPIDAIARALHRSERSIRFRMERLQLIDNADRYPESPEQSTRKDHEDIKRRYLRGESIVDIAACYHISENAVRARLFYLGLSTQSPVSLPNVKQK